MRRAVVFQRIPCWPLMVGCCLVFLLFASTAVLAENSTSENSTSFLELNPDATSSNPTNYTTITNTSQKRKRMKKKTQSQQEKQIQSYKKGKSKRQIVEQTDDDSDDDELNKQDSIKDSSDDEGLVERIILKRKKKINLLRNRILSQKLIKKLWGSVSISSHRKKLLILVAAAGILGSIVLSSSSTSRIFHRFLTWENMVRLLVTFQLLFRLGILNTTNDGEIRILSWNPHHSTIDAYNPPTHQNFMFEKINDRYTKDCVAIGKMIPSTTAPSLTTMGKITAAAAAAIASSAPASSANTSHPNNSKVAVVMEVKADSTFNQIESFRDAISFILHTYRTQPAFQQLEVILLLESAGGLVSTYGLAAYELSRIRKESAAASSNNSTSISLTVCVDKVAASGGYMMACQATPGKLYTAPFAILGSIGVIGQTINVHNVLQSYGIQPLVFKSGDQKSPVGLIGEVTKEGRAKVQQSLEDIHVAFKTLVLHSREESANMDIEKVSTGDIWLGREAVELGLADRIMSSQEYIANRIQQGDIVLQLKSYQREPPFAAFFRSSSSRSPTRPYPFMKAIALAAETIVSKVLTAAASSARVIPTAAVECDSSIRDKLETRSLHTQIDAHCSTNF
jgi:ClpP class serine protease